MTDALRVLLLGGTTDAAELARRLDPDPQVAVTTSLAGRTRAPLAVPGPVRSGGFGGPEGLAEVLRQEGFDVLVDATHPYAATISENAAKACDRTGTPRLLLQRPAWEESPGDRWVHVPDSTVAAARTQTLGRRVFLSLGRQDLAPFVDIADCWFLTRMIDPPAPDLRLPAGDLVLARGPFDQAEERDLLRHHRIDVLVSKNSGGQATYGKIAAARDLGLPVIMIDRPAPPAGPTVSSVADVLVWLGDRITTRPRPTTAVP